ncbi:MAG: hypothetical protein ACR2FV_06365 [Ornithinimicrobium sp.]|uniref:hypothetical protein n=1 Tax=Ornithinimicrobium sp. TaxID=1977084 RepID=UPI003D9ABDEB
MVVVAILPVLSALDSLSNPEGGANIGLGFLGFALLCFVPMIWAPLDARRMTRRTLVAVWAVCTVVVVATLTFARPVDRGGVMGWELDLSLVLLQAVGLGAVVGGVERSHRGEPPTRPAHNLAQARVWVRPRAAKR